jgi:hypothetical protein
VNKLSQTSVGRAGEFFASSILETYGIHTVHVEIPNDDLWCLSPSGEMLRVQVKATMSTHVDRPGSRSDLPIYRFRTGRHKKVYGGIYIFVALDVRLCTAMRWDAQYERPPQSIRFAASQFTPEDESESIRREFLT